MLRSRKALLIVFIVFLAAIIYATWDMARRTTFPGHKRKQGVIIDSVKVDSARTNR